MISLSKFCFLGSAYLLMAACATPIQADEPTGKTWVFVGTYTGGKNGSKGIYRLELDLATGKLSKPEVAAEVTSPSFLAIHPTGKFLYSVNEVDVAKGKKGGAVSAFKLDAASGELKYLNHASTVGAGPCHLVVDKVGKNVLAANYGGGSAVVLPIGSDGKVGEHTGFVQHKGKSVNKSRQEAPHAHSINLDPANKFAFVADLGMDEVLIYRFDPDKGNITANDPTSASVKPGAGPRHFAFHPNGKFAYVINELDMTVTAFTYDPDKGALTNLQTIPTIKGKTKNNYSTAEVVVHPSGKFLYGSNRGHDTIAIFTIDEETGKLTHVGNQGHKIKTPRNFAIEPTGKYMLVASQDGDRVGVFSIDQKTGELSPTGEEAHVPMPVCVRFISRK